MKLRMERSSPIAVNLIIFLFLIKFGKIVSDDLSRAQKETAQHYESLLAPETVRQRVELEAAKQSDDTGMQSNVSAPMPPELGPPTSALAKPDEHLEEEKESACGRSAVSGVTARIEAVGGECRIQILKNNSRVCQLEVRFNVDCGSGGFLSIGKGDRVCGKEGDSRKYSFFRRKLSLHVGARSPFSVELNQVDCSIKRISLASLSYGSERRCCRGDLWRPQEVLTSPRQNTFQDCSYTIRKFNPRVCRLQLQFRYFSVGFGDRSRDICVGGYLQVENYRFCGCQTGLTWFTSTKVFKQGVAVLKYNASPRGGSAFVLLVRQLECSFPPFWPDYSQKSLPLTLSAQQSYLCPPQYFFPSGQGIGELRPNSFSDENRNYCPSWNLAELDLSSNICEPAREPWEGGQGLRDCLTVPLSRGQPISLNSPGYPLSTTVQPFCYRFKTSEENCCGTEVEFKDFSLESSGSGCQAGFLQLGRDGRKLCGVTLKSSTRWLPEGEEVRGQVWAGDRGFALTARPVSCPRKSLGISCGSTVTTDKFLLESPPQQSTCSFAIHKSSPEVCGVRLTLENFDLICGTETILIQDQYYCGKISTETIMTPFIYEKDIIIEYQSLDGIKGTAMYTVRGEQISDCSDDESVGLRSGKSLDGCIITLSDKGGILRSPTLSSKPPEDLQCSYQFLKLPEYCGVQLFFKTFELFGEANLNQAKCLDTYVMLNKENYCHDSLRNTTFDLEFGRQEAVEISYRVNKNAARAVWEILYSQYKCIE